MSGLRAPTAWMSSPFQTRSDTPWTQRATVIMRGLVRDLSAQPGTCIASMAAGRTPIRPHDLSRRACTAHRRSSTLRRSVDGSRVAWSDTARPGDIRAPRRHVLTGRDLRLCHRAPGCGGPARGDSHRGHADRRVRRNAQLGLRRVRPLRARLVLWRSGGLQTTGGRGAPSRPGCHSRCGLQPSRPRGQLSGSVTAGRFFTTAPNAMGRAINYEAPTRSRCGTS